MTIAQRIELRRLGYTKEEINEIIEQEKAPTPDPDPVAEVVEAVTPDPVPETPPTPDINSQLLTAITNLTTVLQTQKLNNTPQPDSIKPETPEDIFNSILKG